MKNLIFNTKYWIGIFVILICLGFIAFRAFSEQETSQSQLDVNILKKQEAFYAALSQKIEAKIESMGIAENEQNDCELAKCCVALKSIAKRAYKAVINKQWAQFCKDVSNLNGENFLNKALGKELFTDLEILAKAPDSIHLKKYNF